MNDKNDLTRSQIDELSAELDTKGGKEINTSKRKSLRTLLAGSGIVVSGSASSKGWQAPIISGLLLDDSIPPIGTTSKP